MTLDESLNECLALFEMYRKLGFRSECIFLDFGHTPGVVGKVVAMTLKAQGKTFTVTVAEVHESGDEVDAAWKRKCNWWNVESTEEERQSLWRNSRAFAERGSMIWAMVSKGFVFSNPDGAN